MGQLRAYWGIDKGEYLFSQPSPALRLTSAIFPVTLGVALASGGIAVDRLLRLSTISISSALAVIYRSIRTYMPVAY